MRFICTLLCMTFIVLPQGRAQSIAQLVSDLNSRVATLEKAGPSGASASSAQSFAFHDVEFRTGLASFKNTYGTKVADIGVSDSGSGGGWFYDGRGRRVADVGALGPNGSAVLQLWNPTPAPNAPNGTDFADLSAGTLTMYNSSGVEVTSTGVGKNENGASWYYSKEGKIVAYVGSGPDGQGMLALTREDGTSIATLFEDRQNGGFLTLSNPTGKAVAQIGAGAQGKGAAWFYDGDGTLVGSIGADANEKGIGELFIRKSQDFAEMFDVAEESDLAPGSVVSASATGGRIVLSETAYDPRVVGVLSGAGGLHPAVTVGGSGGADEMPVAVAGQVYVRVCTEGGAIQIGDLLVASSRPGLAMRASDRSKAIGAIVGKALEPSNAATEGQVSMLVMLH